VTLDASTSTKSYILVKKRSRLTWLLRRLFEYLSIRNLDTALKSLLPSHASWRCLLFFDSNFKHLQQCRCWL